MYESDEDGIFLHFPSQSYFSTQLEKGLPLSKFHFPLPDLRWVPFFLQYSRFSTLQNRPQKKSSHICSRNLYVYGLNTCGMKRGLYNPRFCSSKKQIMSKLQPDICFLFFCTQRFSATHMYSSHIWRQAQIGSLAQFISGGSSAKLLCSNNPRVSV